MESTVSDNRRSTARRVPVGFRYREDLISLVDAVAKRRGVDRSDVLAEATDRMLEEEFPGCTKDAA